MSIGSTLMLGTMLGPWEVTIILLVVVLLFGSKKLPQLARSVGRSLNEFKRGKAEVEKEIAEAAKEVEEGADAISGEAEPASQATTSDKQESSS